MGADACTKRTAFGGVRPLHLARPFDISDLPAAYWDENQPASIGPRSRQPADRLRGMRARIDRAGACDRLLAAGSSARTAVSGAYRIAVPDHSGRHRAPGRDPIPRTDPELHRTEIRYQHGHAAAGRVHFWMRASRQRTPAAAQLALHDTR